MLDELKKFENLGTPNFYWELFQQLQKDDTWTENNVSSYFFNKFIDNRIIFDGCVPLLKLAKIISIHKETKEIEVDFAYQNILFTETLCRHRLLEGFLIAFQKDEVFYSIFSSEHASYDIVYKTIQVDYSAFGLKYANIRNLLIDFDFLLPHPDFPQKKLMINTNYKKFFDKNIAPEIRKRKIGIDELKQRLEQQQINGEKAEIFVLDFEEKRLNKKQGIEWIAPYDIGAGYDILSFNKIDSTENDRFIEVKSFTGKAYFYWSKNEMETARKKRENYFLYLVDRETIDKPGYTPIMITNPMENILRNDDWLKEVNNYYIVQKNNLG